MRQQGERGSIAIELAFLAPVVLLILALIWGYGRVAWANGHLEAGTRDAARVATQARSLQEAQAAAERAVRDATAAVPACQSTARVTLTGRFQPGETITVDATCRYPLGDIGLPGAPGTMNPTSSFSSVLDRHRGVED
ncbi:MAG TPA: TadE family protein [Phototrophicaceae bacterium]|nr:TadE family protein [Phototrophicaceae bacterium]